MPVKTLAMRRLNGQKRSFYCDDGYHHREIDFYPAELVEEIITDLSNQVLEGRKKWNSLFDQFKAKRKELLDDRHAAIAAKDAEIRSVKRALWLVRAERYKMREFIAREEANVRDHIGWSQFLRERTYNQWVGQLLRIANLANKLHNKCLSKAEEYK